MRCGLGKPVECVDCLKSGHPVWRPTPKGGPRSPLCVSCWKARKKAKSAQTHSRMVQATYGITGDEYQLLYEFQGGRCAICQRANGKTRRLAVDHDHELEGRDSVRGLLCGPCNFELLGRHDQQSLERAIEYLNNPPARKVLGE